MCCFVISASQNLILVMDAINQDTMSVVIEVSKMQRFGHKM
jgi:hypothetical protein